MTYVSFVIDPFNPTFLSHGSDSAWPPDRSRGLMPINIQFSWELPAVDEEIQNAMKDLADQLSDEAVAEGQDVAGLPIYGNYALGNVPLEAIYGDNVARLRAIHQAVDPENVMGLCGGFKF